MIEKSVYKKIFPFLVVVFVLFIISIINTFNSKAVANNADEGYKNELSEKILSNNTTDVDYDYLVKDLDEVDSLLKDILNTDKDIKKKSEYYKSAESIYDNKIHEITAILNTVLDDEDFGNLCNDLDEFYKSIDFATSELTTTIKSKVDSTYYIYKYMYEEKQRKCRELLDIYKGFLNKKN